MTGTATTVVEAQRLYRSRSALADTLVDVRRRFGGDLDRYLLYMTVVQAETDHALRQGRAFAGLNALSLAESCGLARETARTKVRQLTQEGLLATSADGLVRPSDPAAAHREYGALAALAEPRP